MLTSVSTSKQELSIWKDTSTCPHPACLSFQDPYLHSLVFWQHLLPLDHGLGADLEGTLPYTGSRGSLFQEQSSKEHLPASAQFSLTPLLQRSGRGMPTSDTEPPQLGWNIVSFSTQVPKSVTLLSETVDFQYEDVVYTVTSKFLTLIFTPPALIIYHHGMNSEPTTATEVHPQPLVIQLP